MKRKKSCRLALLALAVMCFLCFSAQGLYAYTWGNFRGNPENNGVTSVALPTQADDATLYWAKKIGTGWDYAPSPPIIVDDAIVFFCSNIVYKVDSVTGEVIQQGELDAASSSSWNITPPTYCDGSLYVSLANGKLQVMDLETMTAGWLYQNENRGQSNCPVTYHDGYVYTGYWRSSTSEADYVCVDAETGEEVWTLTHTGGFYWAGCYVNDNYLLVGSDDGEGDASTGEGVARSSVFYSVRSGNHSDGGKAQVIDKIEGLNGDIRSTVAFVDEDGDGAGTAYFASQGGSFYGVPVDAEGNLDEENMLEMDLGGKVSCTPVIYNGRAYVGVQGKQGQFVQTDAENIELGHHIDVIDLEKGEVAYSCPTQGCVQTSGLLTTAYEETDGSVYVYFIENYVPGKVRVIKDKPGQTEMDSKSQFAEILFTPAGEQVQYALGSAICDEYGTMYFKNDSCYIMALGWSIKKLEVTKEPDKTEYNAGETFDPAGMVVTATYANGKTRDVTEYVEYSTDPLTEDDIEVTLTFSHVMYRDTDDGNNDNDQNNINQTVSPLYTSVDISVTDSVDHEAVAAVTAKINGLNGRISEKSVAEARIAYEQLTKEEQALVTNLSALTAAETKIKENPFRDVKSGDWYRDGVLFNYWNGLMNGMETTVFAPDKNTTRAQLVVILYRYSGSPAVKGGVPFTDLTADWYQNAVVWAYQNGIVKGTSDDTFSPDAMITREQMVTIFYRYCDEYKGMDVSSVTSVSSFPDAVEISPYAMKPFQWAVKQGYIGGTTDGGRIILAPKGSATRAQIAAVMMRFVLSL
ncbi:MAG: S-layer homology domain-containing protein [Clostridia bacterium]